MNTDRVQDSKEDRPENKGLEEAEKSLGAFSSKEENAPDPDNEKSKE